MDSRVELQRERRRRHGWWSDSGVKRQAFLSRRLPFLWQPLKLVAWKWALLGRVWNYLSAPSPPPFLLAAHLRAAHWVVIEKLLKTQSMLSVDWNRTWVVSVAGHACLWGALFCCHTTRAPHLFAQKPDVVGADARAAGTTASEITPSVITAAEQRADLMFEALVARQYLDLADHFLSRCAASGQYSESWKAGNLFRRATLLIRIAGSGRVKDVDARLEVARQDLQTFIKQNPQSPRLTDANLELANLRMTQGYRALARAESTATESAADTKQRKKWLEETGVAFRSAERQFRQLKNTLTAQLKAIQSGAANDVRASEIDTMRSRLIRARLTIGVLELEQAKLLRDEPAKYEKQIEVALEEFVNLSQDYRERAAGLEAVFYKGVCHQEAGQFQQAILEFDSLNSLAALPEPLLSRNMSHLIQCYLALGQPRKAISRGDIWLARSGSQQKTAASAEATLNLCKAYLAEAHAKNGRDAEKRTTAARRQLLRILQIGGKHRTEAQTMLAQLPIEVPTPRTLGESEEKVEFADAKVRADRLRTQMQSTAMLVALNERKLKTAESRTSRQAAEQELRQSEQNHSRLQDETLKSYRATLKLAEPDPALSESVNEIRHTMAFIEYERMNYLAAAAIGEFVATRYPESDHAIDCANIAMASFQTMLYASDAKDREFEETHLTQIAEYIVDQWPQSKVGQSAIVNLINVAIANGDVEQAESYLSEIPEESSARTPAQLRIGVGLYQFSQRLEAPEAAAVCGRAERLLTAAVEQAAQSTPTASLAQAVVTLAMARNDLGRSADAVELLRDPKIGPITLIENGDPSVASTYVVAQAYRALLASLAGLLALPDTDSGDVVDQISNVLERLDRQSGAISSSGTVLAVAHDLQRQLEEADPQARRKLREGLAKLLAKISDASQPMETRQRVVDMYLALADQAASESTEDAANAGAKRYSLPAQQIIRELLALPNDGKAMTENVRLQLQVKLALALRMAGKYEEAVDQFEKALNVRNRVVNVQVEATETYQMAATVGSTKLYDLAVRGGRPNQEGANIIWGWKKLSSVAGAQMSQGEEKAAQFRDLFFRSRYNMALCRVLQAERESGQIRTNAIRDAQQTIRITRSLYPDLGGDTWNAKFAQLSKRIVAINGNRR